MRKPITLFLVCLCIPFFLFAQEDSLITKDKTKIQIIHADSLRGSKPQGSEDYYNKLIGNVQVKSDDINMTCDSAYLYQKQNFIKAFGNVNIIKGAVTSAKANYVEYQGANAQAIMKDNVQIYDGGNTLITDDLTYNLKTKIGIYQHGGSLVAKETTVSSEYGKYNGYTKQAYFKGDVFITNADNEIESKELSYNTNSKGMHFLDETTVYGKDATIYTKGGTYNETSGEANFTKRTTVENDEQIITGDKIQYNQKTGNGNARGKVIIVDKKENSTLYADIATYNKSTGYGLAEGHVHFLNQDEQSELYAGKVYYNEFNKFLLATDNPLLITVSDNDSIFIVSDTMINLRVLDEQKLTERTKSDGQFTFRLLVEKQEESYDDRKFIICYNSVKIMSDSMQAVADSLTYSQADSVFHLYKKPILWSGTQQAQGDTIHLYTENNKVKKLELRANSFLSNNTGYPNMYDQIKGKDIDAYFEEGEIENVLVDGNAQSIYYTKNEDEKYVGLNKAEGAQIKILFKSKNIHRIVFYDKPIGAFYPMEKIPESERFLADFKWEGVRRPQNKLDMRSGRY